MAYKVDNKFLSVFVEKLVPSWFRSRYPNYEALIKYFLEYLEADNNVYNLVSKMISFIDIDDIDAMTDLELRDKIMYQMYEQYLGSPQARYLSNLIDDVLYLKKQKGIIKYKGTKYSFMFFFLIVIGGYFNVANFDENYKKHNGIFKYDGSISYNNGNGFIEPFIYLVESEFDKSQYEPILKILNPAGMLPISFLVVLSHINEVGNVTLKNNLNVSAKWYIGLYDDITLVGLVKVLEDDPQLYEIVTIGEDLVLSDGVKYKKVISGTNISLYFESLINTSYVVGYFDNYKIIKNPTPNIDLFYLPEDVIFGPSDIIYSQNFDKRYEITDNTHIQIMLDF